MNQLALQLRDEGMAQTLQAERNDWIEWALVSLAIFARRGPFRTEEFRDWYKATPHDHHVWGAFTHLACKRGIIPWTGRYVPSESPKTHGHPVKQWEAA